jgi:hypothetical protein
MPAPSFFFGVVNLSLFLKRKGRLIITFVDLCTLWLLPLLGARDGPPWDANEQTQLVSRAGCSSRSRRKVRPRGGGEAGPGLSDGIYLREDATISRF